MFQSLMSLPMAWTLGEFLKSLETNMRTWVSYIIVIVGIVLLGIGVFKIAKGLASHGKGDVNWVMCIIMIIFGAFLLVGGTSNILNDLKNLGGGAVDTIKGLGSTILPSQFTHIFR